jgi:ATP-binding cassette subfamily C protein
LLAILNQQYGAFGSLPGVLVLFGTMAFRLIPSVNRIITNNNTLRTFSYVLDMVDVGEPVETSPREYEEVQFDKSIELKGVGFQYADGQFVLKDLNLELPKHKKIGIYGDSGVGKTTLLNLLMGFYSPTEGQFLVDGQVLNSSQVRAWRKHIGYVRQDSFVSNGTVLENVAFGYSRDEIDMSKVEKCVSDAKLSSWVHSLDHGLDTEIGEMGSKISGGQKQRIAIARMLYNDADFFVLDEITNSLDRTTSAEILNTVYHLNNSKATIVMISHKPEEFHACDVTYRLQGGHLVQIDNE